MAYKESKFNRLDAPVPGESLTSEPGNYPWESPPQYPKVSDGFLWVFNQMHKEPQLTQLISLLDTGVPVEALAKTLLFTGFLEGKWSVDGAILLTEPVFMALIGIGKNAGVKEINLSMNKKDPMSFARQNFMMKEASKQIAETKKEIRKEIKQTDKPMGLMSRPKSREI